MVNKLSKPKKKSSKKSKAGLFSRFDKWSVVFLIAVIFALVLGAVGFLYITNRISSLNNERESLKQDIEDVRDKNIELEQEIQKKNEEIRTLNDKLTFLPESLLELTNVKRIEAGLRPLLINEKLNESARLKAEDMVNNSYWSHNAPDGTEPWVFFDKVKYGYSWAGENLAKGYSTGSAMVAGWMISPLHKDNLLSTKYREVGFATVYIDSLTPLFNKQVTVAHYGSR